MGEQGDIKNLEQLLDRIDDAAEGRERISVEAVLEAAGRRSFGPILMVPGLIALSPLSGIPGMPTFVGLMVILIAGQLLLGRSEFWLPQFVLRRTLSQSRFKKALKAMRRVACFIDRLLKERLVFLTRGAAPYVIATLCVLLSLMAPVLELLPFVITGVGGALTCFGLSLISNDGLLALFAFVFCALIGIVLGVNAV